MYTCNAYYMGFCTRNKRIRTRYHVFSVLGYDLSTDEGYNLQYNDAFFFSPWVLYTIVCRPLLPSLTTPSCLLS